MRYAHAFCVCVRVGVLAGLCMFAGTQQTLLWFDVDM